jgi:hypothetical protein
MVRAATARAANRAATADSAKLYGIFGRPSDRRADGSARRYRGLLRERASTRSPRWIRLMNARSGPLRRFGSRNRRRVRHLPTWSVRRAASGRFPCRAAGAACAHARANKGNARLLLLRMGPDAGRGSARLPSMFLFMRCRWVSQGRWIPRARWFGRSRSRADLRRLWEFHAAIRGSGATDRQRHHGQVAARQSPRISRRSGSCRFTPSVDPPTSGRRREQIWANYHRKMTSASSSIC